MVLPILSIVSYPIAGHLAGRLPSLDSMAGMRRRNRLTIMVRMSRAALLTDATWKNGMRSLIMIRILTMMERHSRMSWPHRLNRETTQTSMTSMDGLTWSDSPARATTPPPRLTRLTRNTRLPRAGRLTGLHWLAWLTRLIDMTRTTGEAIPEVLYTLTVTSC